MGFQILDVQIEDITRHEEDEDTLLGTCHILGVPHHAQFIRVEDVEGEDDGFGRPSLQQPTNDPHGRYDDMQKVYAGRCYTVNLEQFGFEGQWVVLIHPYCD